MDADFLPILAIVMTILGAGFAIMFAILNYQYNRKRDNLTLTQHKEQELQDNLEMRLRQKLADAVREDMRSYVDREIIYMKKELASAISLTCKDIEFMRRDVTDIKREVEFLNQFSWGRDAKSQPAYLRGEDETMIHDMAEGEGMFRDTAEEKKDRERKKKNNH